ncbi:MAG: hypothetical protein J7539_10360 [Niabella sp.]|nr:hypothetical protein [Niabella sp.]
MKTINCFYATDDPNASAGGDDTKKTDNKGLVTTDTVYVSPDGGDTDEAFPKPNVEYDFCVDVANTGTLPSDSFYVRFTLSGDQDPAKDLDFKQDAGLDANGTVKAVVHFGSFPNTFATYHLEACIYAASNPGTPINCAGSFDITVNTEDNSNSTATTPADTTTTTDPEADDHSGNG